MAHHQLGHGTQAILQYVGNLPAIHFLSVRRGKRKDKERRLTRCFAP